MSDPVSKLIAWVRDPCDPMTSELTDAAEEHYKTVLTQVDQMWSLINESAGVVGLHLNGDMAPWDSLLPGGNFEEWLSEWKEGKP